MTAIDINQHATLRVVDREKLEALAKSQGKSACKLLLEWFADPSTAPDWYLEAVTRVRYRKIGHETRMRLPPKQRKSQGALAANTRYADARWEGSLVKMRRDWRKLRKDAGAEAHDKLAAALGIDPSRYMEAGAEAYAAYIKLRDGLGLKPKRVRRKKA